MSKKRPAWFYLKRSDVTATIVLLLFLALFGGYLIYSDPSEASQGAVVAQESTSNVPDTIPNLYTAEPDTTARTKRYPGPPKREPLPEKMKTGEKIDLNTADSARLVRVPGVGPSFAKRILKYRELLWGYYYCTEQLQEVYGMDREKYSRIEPYLYVKELPAPIKISSFEGGEVRRHPYISFRQASALKRILVRGELPTWKSLYETSLFSVDDSLRLSSYIILE
ncbi:MAG: helix-hairpin-helix domain-containing protein [Porphyromonas sp.]|nr:helix-hairpin-helix domain-containing protein [Porphyromonas sp.]